MREKYPKKCVTMVFNDNHKGAFKIAPTSSLAKAYPKNIVQICHPDISQVQFDKDKIHFRGAIASGENHPAVKTRGIYHTIALDTCVGFEAHTIKSEKMIKREQIDPTINALIDFIH